MKYVLMVILALGAAQANAMEAQEIECAAMSRQDHEGANFLFYPYIFLQTNDGGEMQAMMAVEGEAGSAFGDSICQVCGWGPKATALRFRGEKVTGGPLAFFDANGNLVSIGSALTPVQVVESLTCR
jgi:hypothetical protein